MIRALIFDMDGTLVNSEAVHFAAWQDIFGSHGIDEIPRSELGRYVGVSNERFAADYIERYRLDTDVTTLVGEKQRRYLQLIPSLQPMPGVLELLDAVHSRWPLAIASSSDLIELKRILAHLGLSDHFRHVVGGDMVSRSKPDPEIYTLATHLLEVAPHHAVAFEDSEAGVRAAKRAGLYTIAIPSPFVDQGDFSLADAVLSRIDEAAPLLASLLARDEGRPAEMAADNRNRQP